MEIKIAYIGPSSIDSVTYIVGMISPRQFVVFSPIKKSTILDDFNPNDFGLDNTIDLDISIIGPTDAFNKTKHKSVNICIHEANITGDEVRKKYLPMFR